MPYCKYVLQLFTVDFTGKLQIMYCKNPLQFFYSAPKRLFINKHNFIGRVIL